MKHKRQKDAGVTLLEVLVVLAIMAMVAALATPRLMDSFGRAKQRAAEVQAANLQAAIQLYYLDTGQLPAQSQGLVSLVLQPPGVGGWAGPYSTDEQIKDPWGRPWNYKNPGSNKSFDISTFGKDGQPGGTGENKDILR